MKSIIRKIYHESEFNIQESDENTLFSIKDNIEYFFTAQYTEEEFLDFFESEKTNKIIDLLNQYKKEQSDIKKNTSLVILVVTDDINDFYIKNKNQILSIEEDEYFFRKYVIIYSQKSIENIREEFEVIPQIHDILSKDGGMERFQQNLYKEEEFFIAIQLLVKLPFIKLRSHAKEFQPIEKNIENVLLQSKFAQDAALVLDFINAENFEELRGIMLEGEDSKVLSDFISSFEVRN